MVLNLAVTLEVFPFHNLQPAEDNVSCYSRLVVKDPPDEEQTIVVQYLIDAPDHATLLVRL
jgi:hypothetical protein